jgi:hypothetical protein
MPGNFKHACIVDNRAGAPLTSQSTFFELWERSENSIGDTADVHVNGESDESAVPATLASNDATETFAESIEEMRSADWNADQTALHFTPRRLPTRQGSKK